MPYSGNGSGTPADPYQIVTLAQLQEMKDYLTASFILMNDIDASATSGWNGGKGFIPIGKNSARFTGTFDGQGYKITNLYCHNPTDGNASLFGYIDGADIQNLTLKDVDIEDVDNCGAFFSSSDTQTRPFVIKNCHCSGSVLSTYVSIRESGGFAGDISGDTEHISLIENCNSTCTVTNSAGGRSIGGFAGYIYGTNLVSCYATGEVTGSRDVGGFVGYDDGDSLYEKCCATGNVNDLSTDPYVGGFAGETSSGTVIKQCYSSGNVDAPNAAGGCQVGGFVGVINSNEEYEDCYSWSNITINESCTYYDGVGGFAGCIYGSSIINNCYSIGSVPSLTTPSDDGYWGGFAGYGTTIGGPTFASCYWDIETSGLDTSIGGEGKTTNFMKTNSTYKEWDLNTIWYM